LTRKVQHSLITVFYETPCIYEHFGRVCFSELLVAHARAKNIKNLNFKGDIYSDNTVSTSNLFNRQFVEKDGS
jgi:hypothetical protein